MKLTDTLSVHLDLASRIQAVREALLDHGDPTDVLLDAWRLFDAHRQVEEQVWMPLYADRCSPPLNASPTVLRRDHALIDGLFAAYTTCTTRLDRLDLTADLAHALDHHDQREATSFKPLLDEALTPEERRALLQDHATATRGGGVPTSAPNWSPPSLPEAVDQVRRSLLESRQVDLERCHALLPQGAFGRKARAQLDGILSVHPLEQLERLRRIGILCAAADRVASR